MATLRGGDKEASGALAELEQSTQPSQYFVGVPGVPFILKIHGFAGVASSMKERSGQSKS